MANKQKKGGEALQTQEIRAGKKEEVECERCGKPLGAGDCPRCNGIKLERKKGTYLAA